MYDQILIPTDGSTETEQAANHGLGLARTYDATVHALYVTDTSEYAAVPEADAREQLRTAAEKAGRRATAEVVETAAEFDLTTERGIRQGTPYEEIFDYVDERDIDLVAMGTHGRGGRGPDLGSTTLRVVRNVDVPVLTVRFSEDIHLDLESHYGIFDDVLVATDGSDGSMAAAKQGIGIAEMYGATVHALYVVDTNTYVFEDVPRSIVGILKESGNAGLDEIVEMGREVNVEVETSFRRGRPSQELLDYVDENDVDLLTLGAHGRTSEVHLGSTTERVIRTAEQPTLTVR
ncbi:universal stress protein [Halomicrococcus sp. NG-SE-24]|uniref:universal stress protein n=1 Tax=Halomicrococcus sp. NG-SE-24 TaxID=3436928 RepID=UPI003D960A97